ncbi:MAG: glycosyltransferase family 4 protein [Anaerolineae bacterium]|nr:glycosyltransferase family 4 protein [Anaerolineae bacterium]
MPDALTLVQRFYSLGRMAEAQAAAGAEVHVLERFWRDEDLTNNGVCYCFRSDDPNLLQAKATTMPHKLLHQLARLQPDVVHVHGLLFPAQLLQVRWVLGKRATLVAQHHTERPKLGWRRALQRLGLRCAHGFLFTAHGLVDEWRSANLISPTQPVHDVIEASCDFGMLPQGPSRTNTGLTGNPAILWVKRLHLSKDPLTALRGFAQACQSLPHAHLWMIYGEDQNLDLVQNVLHSHAGLAERVTLVGRKPRHELPAWYSAADLSLTTSLYESCNNALFESLACGALPVCSDIPPHQRLTGDGAHGVLCHTGDAADCARAICQAAQQQTPQRRLTLRKWFETQLSWDAIAQHSLRAYRAIKEHQKHDAKN